MVAVPSATGWLRGLPFIWPYPSLPVISEGWGHMKGSPLGKSTVRGKAARAPGLGGGGRGGHCEETAKMVASTMIGPCNCPYTAFIWVDT